VNVYVFGGSFDPPHVAHVLSVAYVLSATDADQVLVVPCYRHPFGKGLAPFEHRLAMCELAMGWIPNAAVSTVERELGGESWTLRTVEHLREAHPDWRLRLVVGADILTEGRRWHGFDRLVELAPLLVLGRQGITRDDAPPALLPEVSSRAIRDAIRNQRAREIAPLLPRRVLQYIGEHALYGEGTT
jgi:nicotinate-nucleotide adenylyltransferase